MNVPRVQGDTTGLARFLAGGLGGITPVAVSLIVIDLETIRLKATALAMLSYGIRVVALFAIGGLVAWLYTRERERIKLFQLGIAAPALITALINGSRISLPQPADAPSAPATASILSALIPEARAQAPASNAAPRDVKHFSYPSETAAQQITRGLFGRTSKNVWFVITGSHESVNDAEKQARKFREQGFNAEVYAPYPGTRYYAVIIGANMTKADAERLRIKAVQAGLPASSYLWALPQS